MVLNMILYPSNTKFVYDQADIRRWSLNRSNKKTVDTARTNSE